MGSRNTRPLRLVSLALLGLLALLAAVGPAAAQGPRPGASGFGVAVSFAGSFLLTLVGGGIVVAVAPEFVRDVVRRVRAEPVGTALYGLLAFVGGIAALAALAITVVGLVAAVPGVFVFVLYLVVTGLVGTVAVGYILLDAVGDATLWSGVVVGALLSAVLSVVPVLGGVLGFVVSLFGLGAVSVRLYENYRG